LATGAVPPDGERLALLAERFASGEVVGVIESMTGARFVHDQLELVGWDVRIADAQKVKALAALACKTDKIDARLLAELGRLELVPEIWLPDPEVRAERELARFRLHLVKHRTALKNRVHAVLTQHGLPCPLSDLFGKRGKELIGRYTIPEPWPSTVDASLHRIELLDGEIAEQERELRRRGADHRYIPLLTTAPGIAWVLGFTIASEIGEIDRFPTPVKLIGYSGLCPRLFQSGQTDRRGSLAENGPRYLRWALIEAAHHAIRDPRCAPIRERARARHGSKRGTKIAAVTVARKLAESIWYMLTPEQPLLRQAPTSS
jgi:transposase